MGSTPASGSLSLADASASRADAGVAPPLLSAAALSASSSSSSSDCMSSASASSPLSSSTPLAASPPVSCNESLAAAILRQEVTKHPASVVGQHHAVQLLSRVYLQIPVMGRVAAPRQLLHPHLQQEQITVSLGRAQWKASSLQAAALSIGLDVTMARIHP